MEDKRVEWETAILAKEKGFDEKCTYWFSTDKYEEEIEPRSNSEFETEWFKDSYPDFSCMAPTQSLLHFWLREKHGLYVSISVNQFGYGFMYAIIDLEQAVCIKDLTGGVKNRMETFEICLEKGLQQALKLI